MKPDVLKQIGQIEKERAQMIEQEQAKTGQIVMNQPGQPPITLNTTQIVEIIKGQQAQLEQLSKNAHQLDEMNKQLQQMLISKQQEISKLNTEISMLKRVPGAFSSGPTFNSVPIINPVFKIPTQAENKSVPTFTITDPRLI